jgi:alkyl sulfatase
MTTLAPAPARLDVRPLTGTIGAEIRGVDLREPLDDATAAEIRQLWLRHKVVFFADQHLEPVHHVAFGRHFGVLTRAYPVVPGLLPDGNRPA